MTRMRTTSTWAVLALAAVSWAAGCARERPAEPAPVVAPAPVAPAPVPPEAPPPVVATAEVFSRLESEWATALTDKDRAALERLLAPEFLITGVGSTIEDPVGGRDEWLGNVEKYPWPRHDVSDVRLAATGEAVVVKCVWSGVYPPNSLTSEGGVLRLLVTDVWIRQAGDWVVLARHTSLPRQEAQ